MPKLEEIITKMADKVFKDKSHFGVLSTGEQIAVALVMDRYDLLKDSRWTMLEAVDRLGPEWLAASIKAQREAR